MLMSQGSTDGLQREASRNEDWGAWKVGQPERMWRRSKKDFMILMFLSAFISELMLSIYVCFGYFRSIRILIKDLKTDDQFKFAGSKGWTQEWCCTGWRGWGEVFYILLICIRKLWPTWWIGFLTLQVNINWLGLYRYNLEMSLAEQDWFTALRWGNVCDVCLIPRELWYWF